MASLIASSVTPIFQPVSSFHFPDIKSCPLWQPFSVLLLLHPSKTLNTLLLILCLSRFQSPIALFLSFHRKLRVYVYPVRRLFPKLFPKLESCTSDSSNWYFRHHDNIKLGAYFKAATTSPRRARSFNRSSSDCGLVT